MNVQTNSRSVALTQVIPGDVSVIITTDQSQEEHDLRDYLREILDEKEVVNDPSYITAVYRGDTYSPDEVFLTFRDLVLDSEYSIQLSEIHEEQLEGLHLTDVLVLAEVPTC